MVAADIAATGTKILMSVNLRRRYRTMLAVASGLPPGLWRIRSSLSPSSPPADLHHGLHVFEHDRCLGSGADEPVRGVDDDVALGQRVELCKVSPPDTVEVGGPPRAAAEALSSARISPQVGKRCEERRTGTGAFPPVS
jgi:hypothetical protein